MKLSRGVLSLLTVAVVFVAIGAATAWRILAERETEEAEANAELPSTEGIEVAAASVLATTQPVQGTPVVRDTLWIRVVATGTAEAYRQSVVSTRRPGVIEVVLVGESDFVQAGEVLVQLDTLEAAMELDEARANLTSLQNLFQSRMLAGGTIADPELRADRERNLRVEVGMTAAEIRLQRADLEMDLTRVTAPFAGNVADLEAVEGQYVNIGAEVLTLVQLNPIRVQAGVLEADIGSLAEGRSASLRFSAFDDEVFEARVESVNPLVDVATNAGRVTLVLANPGGRILPGMHATVNIDAEALPDRIAVPRESVVERGIPRREAVFMAIRLNAQGEGISEWRYVITGRRNETHVEILETVNAPMLEPGEIVLVDGHQYLSHDLPIRLVDDVYLAGGRPGGDQP